LPVVKEQAENKSYMVHMWVVMLTCNEEKKMQATNLPHCRNTSRNRRSSVELKQKDHEIIKFRRDLFLEKISLDESQSE
jgi:hypothetical protein